MGRPVKFTDQEKEWFARPMRRKNRILAARLERERFLIVCEGEKTETFYFMAFRRALPRHLVEVEILGEGMNTLSLVEKAIEMKGQSLTSDHPFDHVWVVFDRDSFEADNFDNAIYKANAADVNSAWSNEAFELWFLLHFEYRDTGMSRDQYKRKLTSVLGREYRKNDENMYMTLLTQGNQLRAIVWAKALHNNFVRDGIPPSRSNPCTTVYMLAEKLNGFKSQ